MSRLLGVLLAVALVAVGAASYTKGGTLGATGFSIGIAATGFNVLALWLTVRLVGHASSGEPAPRLGATLVALAFLVKLPLLVFAGLYAQRLGQLAGTWFLAGVGLVYSALIGWAMTRS